VAAGAGFDFDSGALVLQVDGKTGMDQVAFFCRPFQVIGGWAVGLAHGGRFATEQKSADARYGQ